VARLSLELVKTDPWRIDTQWAKPGSCYIRSTPNEIQSSGALKATLPFEMGQEQQDGFCILATVE